MTGVRTDQGRASIRVIGAPRTAVNFKVRVASIRHQLRPCRFSQGERLLLGFVVPSRDGIFLERNEEDADIDPPRCELNPCFRRFADHNNVPVLFLVISDDLGWHPEIGRAGIFERTRANGRCSEPNLAYPSLASAPRAARLNGFSAGAVPSKSG